MNDQNLTDEIIIEVPQEEYEADLATGLNDDEVIGPGRHTFRRGGFLARHGIEPEQEATVQKRVLLNLDLDIFTYFDERADDTHSLHARINYVLRKVMELEQGIPKE